VRPLRWLAPLALAMLGAVPGPVRAQPAPAAGGHELLAGAEQAPEVVVGRVAAPTQIDLHGWRATLAVERVLRGERQPGEPLAIAWEELATGRPARFAEGARVAVALAPLPAGSLWSARFPRRDALAVAARGEAFLRDPDAATLDPLAAWLALPAAAREGDAGVAALARLAAAGEPAVAASALARLDRVPSLARRVVGPAADALTELAADTNRPLDLRRAALELAGRRALSALEPAIAALAAQPSAVQGAAVDALGRLRGELEPERVADLLRDPDPAVRAAAVRQGGAAVDAAALRAFLRSDRSDQVRAAAAETLARRENARAADDLVRALRDEAPPVREAAMKGLGALGAPALQALQYEIWQAAPTGPAGALAPAVLTLGLVGPEGVAELRRIAHEHPSENVRRLAELALGRLPERH
jgi:HEAT repeat protein